jgi:hypothetical protein
MAKARNRVLTMRDTLASLSLPGAMAPPLLIQRNTGSPGARPATSAQRARVSQAVGMSGQGMTLSTASSCDPFEVAA